KTSEVAQFDIYDPHNAQTSSANFIVPDGTRVVATLDDRLSTQTAVVGDRFTLRVNDPPEFAGATIDGHVSHLERSGRVTARSVYTQGRNDLELGRGTELTIRSGAPRDTAPR